MQFIADFHIHSKYSRATSKEMNLESLDKWAKIKGIDVLGTGDFTHPAWFKELKEKLEPAEAGLYKLKGKYAKEFRKSGGDWFDSKKQTRFILTVEISQIYSKGGKVILAEILFDISPDCFLVPAHAWTPWFSVFGSMSGFDSLEECFEEYAKYIYAIETGLSSDPAMNWRLSKLDNIALISNSDSHSAQKIGREANIFDAEMNYFSVLEAIKSKNPDKFLSTIEFFPEEGKYHYDGHRACGVSLKPEETKKYKNICPKCGRTLTIGVLNRIDHLADRPESGKPKRAIPFKNLIPLDEIIAEALDMGVKTKAVAAQYQKLIAALGTEFNVLLNAPIEEIKKAAPAHIAEGIRRVREGKVSISPGYDGEYGKIKIFSEKERKDLAKQKALWV
ncbi:MAG: and RNA helicase protein [Candidatus Azambacteria bacterium GW2011_GWC1_46_13]|uniref:And RNA helicase protein n=1 Tax=Candidatus Azambacteria bacterium GW2011_GWC1_46_13 TaxID=1618619 RepID=A0A0G1RLP3_9BACT|nr:MAG: and RNA helicase protein [Candidatus Azambacteria bacterium GW2011_GWC1_46_13]